MSPLSKKYHPFRKQIFGVLLGLLVMPVLWAGDLSAVFVNVDPKDATVLAAVLQAKGYQITTAPPSIGSFSGDLVVWEAKDSEEISAESATALGKFVQNGGNLLLGFDPFPGVTAIRLSFLSPTMAWETRGRAVNGKPAYGEIISGWRDPDFFGSENQNAITLPYYFGIRPFHAVERGMARYDKLNLTNPWINTPHQAGDFFWSRPLLDREWKVRLQGEDRSASPLLITGRYGAGHVAVFASGLAVNDNGLAPIWASFAQWLVEPPLKKGPAPTPDEVEVATSVVPRGTAPESGSLRVTLKNKTTDAVLSVEVLARILTWEQAMVGDETKTVLLSPQQETVVDMPLPLPGPTQYQALSWRDAFVVRLGILSKRVLLAEKVVPVDFRPPTEISVSTDNLYQVPYPYPGAPGSDQNDSWGVNDVSGRMGTPVMAYAYPPGKTVNATVVIANGLRNLAPLAQVKNETTPDDPFTYTLNDEAAVSDKKPQRDYQACGEWTGKAGKENVLSFHFATPVTVSAVTLMGNALDRRGFLEHNPGAVKIECDGHEVASDTTLDTRFRAENGLVRLPFPPTVASDVRIRLPWVEKMGNKSRQEPMLGEIEIEAATTPAPPPVDGEISLILRDSLSGQETVIAKKQITVAAGAREEWKVAVPLPEGTDTRYYQLEARLGTESKEVPILAIAPKQTVLSSDDLHPSDAPQLGFIVTEGFINAFDTAVGTRERTPGSWDMPDNDIWAYSREAKEVAVDGNTKTKWLYLTDTDFKHYANPWTLFPNGEIMFDAMTPVFVERMKQNPGWQNAKSVSLDFSDRWSTGPSIGQMFTWPNFVAFDEYLRTQGGKGLTGRTHEEIAAEIQKSYFPQWCQWQKARYFHSYRGMEKAFGDYGKALTISAQGSPFLPTAEVKEVGQSIRGMSDDNTWDMIYENVPLTTGRELGVLAYNPDWKFSLNVVWGWDSGVLGNLDEHVTVGTTEASRRHYYDTVWRGIVDGDGTYRSATPYGYGSNGGVSYVMGLNDWQESWRALDRFGLIYPEAPLGAGLIVSSSPTDAPDSIYFNGSNDITGSPVGNLIYDTAQLFERLHDAGLSIPFTSNINAVSKWSGNTPLIVQDLSVVTPEEAQKLMDMGKRGDKIAAFAGDKPPVPEVAALFGLNANGGAGDATPAGTVCGVTLLAHGNFLYIPLPAHSLSSTVSLQLSPLLQKWLAQQIVFPEGTMGYGFSSGKQTFIVVEDWLEKGRTVTLRVASNAPSLQAVELNDHQSLKTSREGSDWLIELPLRPGDGDVVVLDHL